MELQTESPETKKKLINQLSSDIIKLSVSRLAVDLRFIQRAVLRLKPLAVKEVSLASDGRVLYYDPMHILNMYKYDENAVNRDILHTVLHLIFLHGYVGKDVRREYWDLATDISVENVINSMDIPCLNSGRKYAQLAYIKLLETEVGELTAEKICAFFRKSGMDLHLSIPL